MDNVHELGHGVDVRHGRCRDLGLDLWRCLPGGIGGAAPRPSPVCREGLRAHRLEVSGRPPPRADLPATDPGRRGHRHLVDHTDERYQPVIWLLVLAGLRSSELCDLRPCDVDWEHHTITINEVQMQVRGELVVKGPKTNSGVRTIPLPEWLIDDLRSVIEN